ncbi:MAG: hypothetical protein IPN92_08220 [Chromatiaceae bacterium]|nr:hypothetical protein [Chromatiaceae bacterium]
MNLIFLARKTTARQLLFITLMASGPVAGEDLDALLNQGHWERPLPLQGPPPLVFGDVEVLTDLSAGACAQCHPLQYAAWRDSLHATALSAGVLGQLDAFDEATRRDCLACHAPQVVAAEGREPEGLAGVTQAVGIDCSVCHVRAHRRHGPRALAETPHGPVVELPLFRRAEFCAPCHQFDSTGLVVNGKPLEDTYAEWLASPQAAAGITCQSCHMPDRAHGFKGIHDPEITRRGLALEVRRTVRGLAVTATNVGAGHRLPTYVTPRIRVQLEGEGDVRREHVIARLMRWSREAGWEELSDDRLAPGQSVELALDLPMGARGRVVVRVEPDWDYHERVYPALLKMLDEELSDVARALLEQAMAASGRTAYDLYRFACPPWQGHQTSCIEHSAEEAP